MPFTFRYVLTVSGKLIVMLYMLASLSSLSICCCCPVPRVFCRQAEPTFVYRGI